MGQDACLSIFGFLALSSESTPPPTPASGCCFGAQGLRPAAEGHVGAPPCPLPQAGAAGPPPSGWKLGLPQGCTAGKGRRRGQEERLELSWNSSQLERGPARGIGEEGGSGGLGPFHPGRIWPSPKKKPRTSGSPGPPHRGASPRAPAEQGERAWPGAPRAPGGLWVLLEGSESPWWPRFGALSAGSPWPWWNLLVPARGSTSLDPSGHSTKEAGTQAGQASPQVHARADGSWLSPRRARIPHQPGILSQSSFWPVAAEAAAAQGCQNHWLVHRMWAPGGRGMTLRPTGQVDGHTLPAQVGKAESIESNGSEGNRPSPSCTVVGDTKAWCP